MKVSDDARVLDAAFASSCDHEVVNGTCSKCGDASFPTEDEQQLVTPRWLEEHLLAHGGGWFFPIPLADDHPLVGEPCSDCGAPFLSSDIVFVMPFHGLDGSMWLYQHRVCTAKQLFGPRAEEVLDLYRERGGKIASFELARFRLEDHVASCEVCRPSRVVVMRTQLQRPPGSTPATEIGGITVFNNSEALCPEGEEFLEEVRHRGNSPSKEKKGP